MVALRILVPPVRVRVLPGQLEKAFNESWTFFFYTFNTHSHTLHRAVSK